MSDGEVDAPTEAPTEVAPAVGEPMDLMTALQMVLKKSLACHSLSRGLHEVTRTIERGEAQLVVLAQDCDNGDYTKLIEGLCNEKSISLLRVPKNTQLGEWVGLCKIDSEGNPTKVVKCSCAAVQDYGEETEGLAVLMEHLKTA
eukprot:CAMPEP_0198235358 /NCGR_PEP_ID=MMETSP1446-20131203/1266_1 /TAXON_ID=1461542 ORGANISM="Unidentified sp, Strain CCMP2111" /NCGR_SAMPLE_ID=MMETSP1446 /ASSEMBLY_ACC=CAM_ASM_001112 /LENGTH=143 /DNA_ID=CAMNT_0043916497 /DNA_START=178 /DNA_END=609 /DNA_ORIENTATION=+